MKVRDLIARFDDFFLDLDVPGVILVAMTEDTPAVASTMRPEQAQKILSLIAQDGDWSNTIERKTN